MRLGRHGAECAAEAPVLQVPPEASADHREPEAPDQLSLVAAKALSRRLLAFCPCKGSCKGAGQGSCKGAGAMLLNEPRRR